MQTINLDHSSVERGWEDERAGEREGTERSHHEGVSVALNRLQLRPSAGEEQRALQRTSRVLKGTVIRPKKLSMSLEHGRVIVTLVNWWYSRGVVSQCNDERRADVFV